LEGEEEWPRKTRKATNKKREDREKVREGEKVRRLRVFRLRDAP
jgi:hypothetical protein